MQSKTKMVTGAAVLSLLLIGVAPAIAESSQGSSASVILQMAQAAHDYAQNLLTIAQQHSIDVSKAQALISQGDQLLTQAQSELTSNPTQAAKDALQAMRDYRDAARSIQANLVDFVKDSFRTERLQSAIKRAQDRAADIEKLLDKVCSVSTAPQDVCTDAKNALAQATTDLQQASRMAPTDPSGAAKLLADAAKLLGQVHTDIAKLADSVKAERALDYIQNKLQGRLNEISQMIQKANLPPALLQQVQGQLSQAQTSLTSAISDFKAGNFAMGVHDAQQAMQLLQQIVSEIRASATHP